MRYQIVQLLLLTLFSCSSTSDDATDAVFEVYGGEVTSSAELTVDTESGKSITRNVTVKWLKDFPDEMEESSVVNIANIYYQNLTNSEKENLELVVSRIEDPKSYIQVELKKEELTEFELLYPVTLSLFRAILENDTIRFYKLTAFDTDSAHIDFFNGLDRIEKESGQITEVFFKGCKTVNGQVLITHMYYSESGTVYNGHFKINRDDKLIYGIEFTK